MVIASLSPVITQLIPHPDTVLSVFFVFSGIPWFLSSTISSCVLGAANSRFVGLVVVVCMGVMELAGVVVAE